MDSGLRIISREVDTRWNWVQLMVRWVGGEEKGHKVSEMLCEWGKEELANRLRFNWKRARLNLLARIQQPFLDG